MADGENTKLVKDLAIRFAPKIIGWVKGWWARRRARSTPSQEPSTNDPAGEQSNQEAQSQGLTRMLRG